MTDERREGWRMVPEKATPEMLSRFHEAVHTWMEDETIDDGYVWDAMLASSPNPPEVVQDEG